MCASTLVPSSILVPCVQLVPSSKCSLHGALIALSAFAPRFLSTWPHTSNAFNSVNLSVLHGGKMVGHDRTWTCNVQIRGLMYYPLICNALLGRWQSGVLGFKRCNLGCWKLFECCNLCWNLSDHDKLSGAFNTLNPQMICSLDMSPLMVMSTRWKLRLRRLDSNSQKQRCKKNRLLWGAWPIFTKILH